MIQKFCSSVIYPIPPCFDSNDQFDHLSISGYLNHLQKNGAKVFLTTAGTSRYNFLSDREFIVFNETCASTSKESGAVFIMGLPPYADKHLDYFINFSNDIKPDAVLTVYPDRYYGDTPIVEYFHRIADKSEVPVMVHGMFMRHALGGTYEFTADLVNAIKQHENIIGMKEESINLNLAYLISKLADDNFLVFPAGGSCRRYLLTHPAGAQTFLGGIGNIFTEIEEYFFELVKSEKQTEANKIVREFEDPLFAVFSKIGWHMALQEALNHTNLLQTFNRKPFAPISEDKAKAVHDVLEDIKTRWQNYDR